MAPRSAFGGGIALEDRKPHHLGMEIFWSGVGLASVTGLAWLAYHHHVEYRRVGVVLGAIAVVGWLAVEAFDIGVEAASKYSLHTVSFSCSAVAALRVPFYPIQACMLAFGVYAFALKVLPLILDLDGCG